MTAEAWSFPHWGTAADLVRLIDVEPVGDGRFRAPGHPTERNVVEGGQLLGQAVVAAGKTAPGQRVIVASMVFAKSVAFDDDVEIAVDVVRAGRSFTTVQVRTAQAGVDRAAATVMLTAGAESVVGQTASLPPVPGPHDAEPLDMGVDGRELRVVDGAYAPNPPVGPAELHTWCRFDDDPGSDHLRTALMAQSMTHWTIAAAMRPHRGLSEADAHVTLSTGVMAVSAAFHRVPDVTEWLLYENRATGGADGLVHGDGRIFGAGGSHVASYSVEAMVRSMPEGRRVDPATTM